MVYNEDLVAKLKGYCEWIAPISAYPGEFEMEAMASGAERVLDGEEEVKKYTGECRFQGFEFYKIMAMEKGAAQIKMCGTLRL